MHGKLIVVQPKPKVLLLWTQKLSTTTLQSSVYLWSILILCSHLCIDIPSGLFPTSILFAIIIFVIRSNLGYSHQINTLPFLQPFSIYSTRHNLNTIRNIYKQIIHPHLVPTLPPPFHGVQMSNLTFVVNYCKHLCEWIVAQVAVLVKSHVSYFDYIKLRCFRCLKTTLSNKSCFMKKTTD
jgi:hypothetical protein